MTRWPWKCIRWWCIKIFAASKMQIWCCCWYTGRWCKRYWRSWRTATRKTMRTTIMMITLLMVTMIFYMIRWCNNIFGRCREILLRRTARVLLCIISLIVAVITVITVVINLIVIIEKCHLSTIVTTILVCILLVIWARIIPDVRRRKRKKIGKNLI